MSTNKVKTPKAVSVKPATKPCEPAKAERIILRPTKRSTLGRARIRAAVEAAIRQAKIPAA